MINKVKNGWNIKATYIKPNQQTEARELFYENYNDFLEKSNADNDTLIILNDLPYEEADNENRATDKKDRK